MTDHVRERLASSVGISQYGEFGPKDVAEKPKENRAIIGAFHGRN